MRRPITRTRVMHAADAIAQACDVETARILAHRRDPYSTPARLVLYATLARHGFTASEIARALNRDHSTVLHGIKRGEQLIAQDADYAAAHQSARTVLEATV